MQETTTQAITQDTAKETTPESTPAEPRGAPKVARAAKSQYSETEAAAELGITVEALRKMIRSHVVDRDEDVGNIPATTFQPSDLLVLRLLAGKALGSAE